MNRRAFIGGVALGALAAPRITLAQPTRKVFRIGTLGLGATADLVGPQPRNPAHDALLRGLRELGYVYGQDFMTEPRGAESRPERFAGLAAELIRLQVDVIVAPGPMLPALKRATSTIPVVMAGAVDPVGEGLVQSLGHPGGNFTGLSLQGVAAGKRLELLKELIPSAELVAVLWDREALPYWQAVEAAARERSWRLLSLEVRDVGEIEAAFRAAKAVRAGALLVIGGGRTFPEARRIAELAARYRLPAMFGLRPHVEAGGLVSYGANLNEIWRRAAVFVDKLLKGANPADLPVEQPTKFELVINLKTAKALRLTIPQSVLLRADDLIH